MSVLSNVSVNDVGSDQESDSIVDDNRGFELRDITSTLTVLSEEMNEVKTRQDITFDGAVSRQSRSDSQEGSADYNAFSGTVAVEFPISVSGHASVAGEKKGSLKDMLSMSAQNSIRKLKEQVKSGAVFGQLMNSTIMARWDT